MMGARRWLQNEANNLDLTPCSVGNGQLAKALTTTDLYGTGAYSIVVSKRPRLTHLRPLWRELALNRLRRFS
jgi:hypothetical protein